MNNFSDIEYLKNYQFVISKKFEIQVRQPKG